MIRPAWSKGMQAVLGTLFGLFFSLSGDAFGEEQTTSPQLAHCGQSHAFSVTGAHGRLARGFNLPNWAPSYQGYRPDTFLLEHLRAEGFSHVRLPVPAEKIMARFTSGNERKILIDALDAMVLRLVALDYAVSIDLHPHGPFARLHKDHPEEALTILKEGWDYLVSHAHDWPKSRIYFELLNEPTPEPDLWWQQAQSLVTHLNQADPGRSLIVGPAVFQRYEPLLGSKPLAGDNLLYAIHFYDPFLFTHQAMTWAPGSYAGELSHLPFPADINHPALKKQIAKFKKNGRSDIVRALEETYQLPWDAARIKATFAKVGEWSVRHKAPVIVNEFGVLNFAVDGVDRAAWLRAVREGAEAACLGWAHWDFSDGFAMVDPETTIPDPHVMEALLGR